MNRKTTERGFRPQLHYAMMVLIWLIMAGVVGLYWYFVRSDNWRPHAMWWTGTTLLVAVSVFVAAALVICRFWRRSHRIWSLAVFMLSVAPLVWLGIAIGTMVSLADSRGDIRLSTPVRILGIWIGNYFETESRWRYPRVTEGDHVQLFEDGSISDTGPMVREMDEHIQGMVRLLGETDWKWKASWVRGPLFNQNGRAIGLWAICNTGSQSNTLETLDKHEVAHTVITSMCQVDQDPPMLFAEGWAESQSVDRQRLIINLFDQKQYGLNRSLSDLTSDDFYGRSVSFVYGHGGPLVVYLLERFGGPAFLDLYGQVRRPTFDQDVHRILKVSWKELESDFWQWLDREALAVRNKMESQPSFVPPVVFTRQDDRILWDQMIQSASRHSGTLAERPDSAAFELRIEQDDAPFLMRAVFENDSAWVIAEYINKVFPTEYTLWTPDEIAFLHEMPDGNLYDDPEQGQSRFAISKSMEHVWAWTRMNRLGDAFAVNVLDPPIQTNANITIDRIVAGSDETPLWTVHAKTAFANNPDNDYSLELTLDPESGFDVTRSVVRRRGGGGHEVVNERGTLFGVMTAIHSRLTSDDGNSTTTIRPIDSELAQEVTMKVEQVVARGPVREHVDWNKRVLRPGVLALAWPVLAFLVLGIDMIGERVKIRVHVQPVSNESEVP